ncbi:hypothetical protein [Rudaeicoccus suwonensis]|uniref:Cell wall-associated NlpC family hydrolase n=1 Tax=Rudaeicoccus suwonensis TaxID=657409 RepID=A0A561E9P3_9MICO|nr:hypothetical protein [Rudaeicoccus suwonensis]TWE12321.1 cell wall-associated NlpC family hydrolase [Rudaeicoccus suwonensis]
MNLKKTTITMLVAGSFAVAPAAFAATGTAAPHAAPRVGRSTVTTTPTTVEPALTGTQIHQRALAWIDEHVPYSQTTYVDGPAPYVGPYRTDCSGFVSMAWGLNTSDTTQSLRGVATQITDSQLQMGDILDYNSTKDPTDGSHVVMFVSWANAQHTAYLADENDGQQGAVEHVIPFPYYPGVMDGSSTWIAYRDNNLVPPVAPPVTGRVTGKIAMVTRANGEVDVVAPLPKTGQLVEYVRPAGSTTWSARPISGAFGSSPSLSLSSAGALDLVYQGAGGTQLWRAHQASTGASWALDKVTGAFGSDPVAVTRSSGELDVAYVGAGGTQIWIASQPSGKNWSVNKVTGAFGNQLTAGLSSDSKTLDLAYVGAGSTQIWQTSAANGSDTSWSESKVTGAFGSDPVLLQQPDGKLDVAYVGAGSSQIWFATGTPGSWALQKAVGAFGGDLGTGLSSNGTFDITYVGSGSTQLWRTVHPVGGSSWAGAKLTGAFGSEAATTMQGSGTTETAYVGAGSDQLWLATQPSGGTVVGKIGTGTTASAS